MALLIEIQKRSEKFGIYVDRYPDTCPYCHNKISSNPIMGVENSNNNQFDVLFQCNNFDCARGFVAHFNFNGGSLSYYSNTEGGNLQQAQISNAVGDLSPNFKLIFNQAFAAEQHNLSEIAGVGYRKSLEFLVKDFCIVIRPDKEENIKSNPLAKVIADYVPNDNIKKVANRAAWIGNDETHYVKKWENKDIHDLKVLIDLSVRWIEMEILTMQYEDEMPRQ